MLRMEGEPDLSPEARRAPGGKPAKFQRPNSRPGPGKDGPRREGKKPHRKGPKKAW